MKKKTVLELERRQREENKRYRPIIDLPIQKIPEEDKLKKVRRKTPKIVHEIEETDKINALNEEKEKKEKKIADLSEKIKEIETKIETMKKILTIDVSEQDYIKELAKKEI